MNSFWPALGPTAIRVLQRDDLCRATARVAGAGTDDVQHEVTLLDVHASQLDPVTYQLRIQVPILRAQLVDHRDVVENAGAAEVGREHYRGFVFAIAVEVSARHHVAQEIHAWDACAARLRRRAFPVSGLEQDAAVDALEARIGRILQACQAERLRIRADRRGRARRHNQEPNRESSQVALHRVR